MHRNIIEPIILTDQRTGRGGRTKSTVSTDSCEMNKCIYIDILYVNQRIN